MTTCRWRMGDACIQLPLLAATGDAWHGLPRWPHSSLLPEASHLHGHHSSPILYPTPGRTPLDLSWGHGQRCRWSLIWGRLWCRGPVVSTLGKGACYYLFDSLTEGRGSRGTLDEAGCSPQYHNQSINQSTGEKHWWIYFLNYRNHLCSRMYVLQWYLTG